MPATRLRIAFVNTLYPPHGGAGAETTLRMLARQLVARGHHCTVITLTPERSAAAGVIDGVPIHYLPLANVYWPHGERRPRALRPLFQAIDAYNPVMTRRLGRMLRDIKPDVVNCHNLQGFSVSAWSACKRLGIPVVQTLHDYYTACPRSAMWRPGRGNCATPCAECRVFGAPRRALSRLPAAVTCVSHRVLHRLNAAGVFADARGGAQGARIIRGNNAADELPPLPPPRAAGPLRLGFMGRLDPSKGVENLLDAFSRLPGGAASLQIAGGGRGDYAETLHRRAAAQADVRFLGHVAPDSFFPNIDLLVIPSVWEDPFPRVFHEALAYGVPSLTTNLGGLPEVIEPGRTGFVAAGADARSLFDALLKLIDRDVAFMRDSCREAAAAYAPRRIVAQYEAVLLAAAGVALPDDAGDAWPADLRQSVVAHGG